MFWAAVGPDVINKKNTWFPLIFYVLCGCGPRRKKQKKMHSYPLFFYVLAGCGPRAPLAPRSRKKMLVGASSLRLFISGSVSVIIAVYQ